MASSTLLVTLGTSPAIVAEAFLLPGVDFDAVRVLTSETTKVGDVRDFFSEHYPGLSIQIDRVADFIDLRSELDHFAFEEVLYRWMLASEPVASRRYVCLTGGFKTMSAAMQKAAGMLGAAEVFHVLADIKPPPSTSAEILAAFENKQLHWVRLGLEPGWPQLADAGAGQFPLHSVEIAAGENRISVTDGQSFRLKVRDVVEATQRIAGALARLSELPFPDLAVWSNAELVWLAQPCEPERDGEWIAALPKVELHTHLGGFATAGPMLDEVRDAAENPEFIPLRQTANLPAGWPLPAQPIGLDAYMKLGDNNGSRLLKDAGCLKRQCKLLYDALCEDNVVYAEIRCSPVNYSDSSQNRSAWEVLSDIRNHFDRLMNTTRDDGRNCEVHLLVIATRRNDGDRSALSRHLALAITAAQHWIQGCRVVGVDLAGYESAFTRAGVFAADFESVHRVGLGVTIHAGENDDAEGIWQAVFKLNARRIGHGLRLGEAPDLLRGVADRGIGVEMCPYANVQIAGFSPVLDGGATYPLAEYLAKGVKASVNTDNIGISAADLSANFLLLARLNPKLTRLDILRLIRNAVDTAFVEAGERPVLFRRIGTRIPHPRNQRN